MVCVAHDCHRDHFDHGRLLQLVGAVLMPWDSGKQFAGKHNKKLKGAAANKAKNVANAMIEKGLPEGEAIATANKIGNKANRLRKRGAISDKAAKKHGMD